MLDVLVLLLFEWFEFVVFYGLVWFLFEVCVVELMVVDDEVFEVVLNDVIGMVVGWLKFVGGCVVWLLVLVWVELVVGLGWVLLGDVVYLVYLLVG